MRFIVYHILLLFIFITPVKAQEEVPSPNIKQGAGLLFSDLNGALPKGLWWKQNRSDIIYLLQTLPADAPSRAVQEIKRNMLVSYYDTSVIEDDIVDGDGTGLLSVRLQKLMEMGFWEDAFKLYTDNIEDPGEISTLAEIGVMIIMTMQGISTACLEEKVLYERFSALPFWQILDDVCSIELGMMKEQDANFTDSSVLQAIYLDPEFNIKANDIEALGALSGLELSILSLKKKIDYSNFAPSTQTPPHITALFLRDKNLSDDQKSKLNNIAVQQALAPLPELTEADNKLMTNADNAPQSEIKALVAKLLRHNEVIPETITNRLGVLAESHPENYFIIRVINHVDENYGNNVIAEDNFNLGLEAIRKNHPQKVIFLHNALDNDALFSNNPDTIYEKRATLTPDDTYVISEDRSKTQMNEWLKATLSHRMAGLSLLLVLSNIEYNANGEGNFHPVKSLSTVGLINQAHHLTREKLAELIEVL